MLEGTPEERGLGVASTSELASTWACFFVSALAQPVLPCIGLYLLTFPLHCTVQSSGDHRSWGLDIENDISFCLGETRVEFSQIVIGETKQNQTKKRVVEANFCFVFCFVFFQF